MNKCICCGCSFEKNAHNQIYCSKKCKSKVNKRTYYLKNKDRELIKMKKRYFSNHESELKRRNEYYIKNKDVILEQHKQWKKDNLESIKLSQKSKENRFKNRIRERTRKLNIIKEKCSHCGSKTNLDYHHLTYNELNVIVLCKTCHGKEHRLNVKEVFEDE